jgi:hypothetical protein
MRSLFCHRPVAPKRRRISCVEFLEGRDLMSVVSPVAHGGPPIGVNPSPPIIAPGPHGPTSPIGLPPAPTSPPGPVS